jgi:hypothetical protein
MAVTAPKQVLVSDITYLSLMGRKHAYLFLVSDLYSRKIVGFHLSRDLSHYSAVLALDNAVKLMGDVRGNRFLSGVLATRSEMLFPKFRRKEMNILGGV